MKLISRTNQTRHKIPYFLLVALVFSYILYLENTWSTPDEDKLNEEINAILQKYKPKETRVGISIFSISKNKSLYKSNSNESFVVASNMKLFTTATALVYLGADFEYKTGILYSGSISSDGKLKGDIIIRGSGDPNISGRFFEGEITAVPAYWADAIKKQGIKVVMARNKSARLILKEGINRQIRRMLGKLGYTVVKLKRIRIGKLALGDLKEGKWQKVKKENII